VVFDKWQSNGNDYILVEEEGLPFELTPARIRLLCSRHLGVGSDGILLLSATFDRGCSGGMRVFNPDGSEDEMSGNGACQAAAYLNRLRGQAGGRVDLQTAAGPVHVEVALDGACRLYMGRASLRSRDFPSGPPDGRGVLRAAGADISFRHVFVGNPQCAIELARPLDSEAFQARARAIETHAQFPNRTNVSFWCRESEREISARIFERGVGETLSSTTGACGAAVAAVLAGVLSPLTVRMPGGDLDVEVDEQFSLVVRNCATHVFSGALSASLMDRLRCLGSSPLVGSSRSL